MTCETCFCKLGKYLQRLTIISPTTILKEIPTILTVIPTTIHTLTPISTTPPTRTILTTRVLADGDYMKQFIISQIYQDISQSR